jgi:HD-GYP domain-containing protein (c-di-GMP phosphodiesterase class II)
MVDPAIADALAAHATSIFGTASAIDPHLAVLDAEPEPRRAVAGPRIGEIAAAFADLVDLKSPFLHGHSAGVARLSRAAGERLGLAQGELGQLSNAALLHDLGRVGIPDSVWERPGPLTAPQWEQVRMHPYHSERALARSTALAPLATIVGMHHERLDGSGYHRGAHAREIVRAARIIAAADSYDAMTHVRPWRDALGPDAAAEQIRIDVRAGRLDPDAARAVLEGAGRERDRLDRPPPPAGLTEREVEVLRLVAEGLSNREIGDRLFISARTAEHHVQNMYAKVGVSSRAAAALFAMEHGLLD